MPTVITSSIGSAGGRDYSTLQAWEDAAPANLVTADQVWRGECYADSEFSSTATLLTISGSTSDATRYKELTAAAGQSFCDGVANPLKYATSHGVSIRCSHDYQAAISIDEQNVRVSRLQIQANREAILSASAAGAANQFLSNLLLVRVNGNGPALFTRTARVFNSIIIQRAGGFGVSFSYTSGTVGMYNCTVVRPSGVTVGGSAFQADSGTIALVNCAAFGFTNEVSNAGRFSASNCVTDKSSPMTGFTTLAYDTAGGSGFEAIANSAHDYRLKSTSGLIGAGTATSAPDADIFGTSRPQGAGYDIGAHEYAASAPAGILGEVASTLGALSLAATGSLQSSSSGALTASLAALTSASAGKVSIKATLARTLAPATLGAVATTAPAKTGVLAGTLAPLTLSATGAAAAINAGTLAAQLDGLTLAATAATAPGKQGALAATLAPLTLAAAGASVAAKQGALSATLAPVQLAAAGTLQAVGGGNVTATLADASLAAAARVMLTAGASVTLAPAQLAAAGTSPRRADAAIQLDGLQLVASATLMSSGGGVVSQVLADAAVLATGASPRRAQLTAGLAGVVFAAAGRDTTVPDTRSPSVKRRVTYGAVARAVRVSTPPRRVFP